MLRLGDLALRRGASEEALGWIWQAIHGRPQEVGGYHRLADWHLRQGDIDAAEEAIATAQELAPLQRRSSASTQRDRSAARRLPSRHRVGQKEYRVASR